MGAYFSPSLFPQSAVISLTDDNSTFFLARPAAFGPLLPVKSLSGQLWIGSGFGDDNLGRNSPSSNVEGELGCSDVPGWSDSESRVEAIKQGISGKDRVDAGGPHVGAAEATVSTDGIKSDDGTDDHILASSGGAGKRKNKDRKGTKSSHADIQSLQESAEIAGKIVLLSRGGCGFLDKVKWAQRRGAVAVIIGDDIRGGPLVTMYARGDTSNVTISALFTSHTTAHLLSSLMPLGNKTTINPEDANRLGVALGDGAKTVKKVKQNVRPKVKAAKEKAPVAPETKVAEAQQVAKEESMKQDTKRDVEGSGWFWSMFGTAGSGSQRPPKSTNVDWVMQKDFDEKEGVATKKTKSDTKQQKPSDDSFKIGVHDWRDPDLVAAQKELMTDQKTDSKKAQTNKVVDSPASGKTSSVRSSNAKRSTPGKASSNRKSKTWLSRLVHGDWQESKPAPISSANIIEAAQPVSNPVHMHDIHIPGAMYDEPTEHDGLWITLTPTSMSSSPFFDTLLVLVVSPLVTLTVVYALLLLRSRIRRRRWRAPKSVVERLPVRTYQTMTSSPTSSTTSAVSTPATANTPLLSASSPRTIRPRPRSRTDSQVPAHASSSSQSLEQEEEKRDAGLSEWRRKYGGKQKECVICLEEYIDGVSRIMRSALWP
ncbi:hypothetical protein AMS68_004731 [Peltaster fructicola]|uniref:PA domain-containing protein n=1 Tax=Peltaster fructicola TaxID=286661 RepID=A0A6H0XWW0_9PEZI|nr:hypothetical protein AMS68_004731 [Peltaster fructicola]